MPCSTKPALSRIRTSAATSTTQIDQIVSGDAIFLAPFRGTSTWFFQPNVRGLKIVNQRIWNAIDQIYIAQ